MENIMQKEILAKSYNLRTCLLYTSDAADEEDSVELGGRPVIEKKERGRKNSKR
ncbi:hypothetical protein CDFC105_93916 [Clostridioides difficile]|nr:hypothetical protein CDFC105_93916 [Clostridioides difficile]